MSSSLWPNFTSLTPPRGMREMLTSAGSGLDQQTGGKVSFYVDILGLGHVVKKTRYNCYLRVNKTGYMHLLFQVHTPVPGPWPADVATPDGDEYKDIQSETDLLQRLGLIFNSDRTKEVVLYLLSLG